jgi:DNA (cytosine-5)-methyltransferase 1
VNGGLSTATMTGAVYVSWLFSRALGGDILGGTLLGWKTVCAVERDAYCAAVLAQRQADGCLPIFAIWSDITSFDGRPWRDFVDVVSGGFPCQDISVAGSGDGLDGERVSREGRPARTL